MTGGVATRPNVLFLITDQQRADHVGFMGNEVVRTPHLDAVAARGTVFEQAWVANPVCMPNRSTIMTGRMPTAHGVIFNDRSLEWDANTWVRQFRAAGYRTALIGKSHLQHGMSRNSVNAYPGQPTLAGHFPELWDNVEHFERYVGDDVPPDPDDFYGFDTIELAIDHGSRITGHHMRWALENGASPDDVLAPMTAESAALDRSDHWWQIYRAPYDPRFHSTTFVTERTRAFIAEAAGQGTPWVAFASFPDPHHPMSPPGEWFDRHDPADMAVPASFDDPLKRAPEHIRRCRARRTDEQRMWVQPCGADSPELVQEAIAATYGMIEMIDDGVGRILATVDELGQTEDTVVVVTSDHGDMMGEHGLMMKGFMPYRGTQQVPMVVSAPGRPAARTASLIGSIDLGPTLLDLAGLDRYDGIQGRSQVPVLDDPTTSVRDHVLIEDDFTPHLSARAGIPERSRTIVTADARYTRNSAGEELLFHQADDPDELHDLTAADPSLRLAMIEHLADAMMEADELTRGAPAAEPVPTA